MRILIDAMGGDNAPQAPVMGALRAVKELGVSVTLIGQKEKIEPLLNGESGVDIVDAREIVTMEHGHPPQEGLQHGSRAQDAARW